MSIGYSEMLLILVVALLLFGRRLPEVSRSVGRTIGRLKQSLRDLEREIDWDASGRPPAEDPKPGDSAPDVEAVAREKPMLPRNPPGDAPSA